MTQAHLITGNFSCQSQVVVGNLEEPLPVRVTHPGLDGPVFWAVSCAVSRLIAAISLDVYSLTLVLVMLMGIS